MRIEKDGIEGVMIVEGPPSAKIVISSAFKKVAVVKTKGSTLAALFYVVTVGLRTTTEVIGFSAYLSNSRRQTLRQVL